ncbi:MAG TPA: OsmC family protein, partial [Miltoncostaea sp.]|nr:OsmC family protein [Miltoncostaea sp.]
PVPLPDVIADIRANPAHGRLTLAVSGGLVEGVRCTATARGHTLDVDEPTMIGGTDAGPNPVELVLAALGTCQAITYRVWAAMLDIRLDDVLFETEGDIDLNGLFGLQEGVRPGFTRLRHHVVLIGPESAERYRELVEAVDRHCPVLDIVSSPEPVAREVEVRAA